MKHPLLTPTGLVGVVGYLFLVTQFCPTVASAQSCGETELSGFLSGTTPCLSGGPASADAVYACQRRCDGSDRNVTSCSECIVSSGCGAAGPNGTLCSTLGATVCCAPANDLCPSCGSTLSPPNFRPLDRVCESFVGDETLISSGSHALPAIPLVDVRGPWKVPMRFEVYYQSSATIPQAATRASGGVWIDAQWVGPQWGHTLTEAISMTRVYGGVTQRLDPDSFDTVLNWTSPGLACGTTPPNQIQIQYRLPWGAMETHTWATSGPGSVSCANFTIGGAPWTRLASPLGSPYQIDVSRSMNPAANERFRVTDLRSGIVSTFDTHGRILSKQAPLTTSTTFGWTVTYDDTAVTGRGRVATWTHSSGHQITFDYATTPPNPTPSLRSVSLRGPNDPAPVEIARFIVPSTMGDVRGNNAINEIQMVRQGGSWKFDYLTSTAGGVSVQRYSRMIRATDPYGVRVFEASAQSPNATFAGTPSYRIRSMRDPSGAWEFRRKDTPLADTLVLPGGLPPPQSPADELPNPCSSVGAVAVLDQRHVQRTASFQPVACTTSNESTTCGAGFLCSNAGQCVRYRCQHSLGSTPDSVDATDWLRDSATSPNFRTLTWTTVSGGGQVLRRISARQFRSGRIDSFMWDNRGRLLAACEGDDDTTVTTDPASCPDTSGRWRQWWYYDTPIPGATATETSILANTPIPPGAMFNPWAVRAIAERGIMSTAGNLAPPNYNIGLTLFSLSSSVQPAGDGAGNILTRRSLIRTRSSNVGWAPVLQNLYQEFRYSPVNGAIAERGDDNQALVTGSGTRERFLYHSGGQGLKSHQLYRRYRAKVSAPADIIYEEFGAYDRQGRVVSVVRDGIPTNFNYSPTTDRLQSIDRAPVGATPLRTLFSYNANGLLAAITRPSGQATVFRYATETVGGRTFWLSHRPRTVITSDAIDSSQASFDASNLPAVQDAFLGAAQATTIDPLAFIRDEMMYSYASYAVAPTLPSEPAIGSISSAIESADRLVRDDRGRPSFHRNFASGLRTEYQYAADGSLARIVEPTAPGESARTVEFTRDSLGRVQTLQRTLGGVTIAQSQFTYVANFPKPTVVTGPSGAQTTYQYDDLGRLVRVSSAETGTTFTDFGETSGTQPANRLEADNTTTRFEYDEFGRLVWIRYRFGLANRTDHEGDEEYTYDALPVGDSCPATDACQNTVNRLARVRLYQISASAPTQLYFGYDSAGRQTAETLRIGAGSAYTTRYVYDSKGRVVFTSFPLGTGDEQQNTYELSGLAPFTRESVNRVSSTLSGFAYRTLVDRIDRNTTGAITRMWYRPSTASSAPSVDRTYSADRSLASQVWRAGTGNASILASLQYTRNARRQTVSISNTGSSANYPSRYFVYDSYGGLNCQRSNAGSDCSGATFGYTNGVNGRRQSFSAPDAYGTRSFSYGANDSRYLVESFGSWLSNVNYVWGGAAYLQQAPYQLYQQWIGGWDNRSYNYWSRGTISSVATYDAQCGAVIYRNFLSDHRGRTIAVLQQAGPCSSSEEHLYFHNPAGQLISARHSDLSYGTRRDELYYWIDNEPVFRYVLNENMSELERTFFFNDPDGTPRLGLSVASDLSAPTSDGQPGSGVFGVSYRAPLEPYMAGPPAFSTTVTAVPLRLAGQAFIPLAFGLDPYDQHVMANQRLYMPYTGGYSSAAPALFEPQAEFYSQPAFLAYGSNDPIRNSDRTGHGDAPRVREFDRALSSLAGVCPETDSGCLLEPWQQPELQQLRAPAETCEVEVCRGTSGPACEQCCAAATQVGDNGCYRRCVNICSPR